MVFVIVFVCICGTNKIRIGFAFCNLRWPASVLPIHPTGFNQLIFVVVIRGQEFSDEKARMQGYDHSRQTLDVAIKIRILDVRALALVFPSILV